MDCDGIHLVAGFMVVANAAPRLGSDRGRWSFVCTLRCSHCQLATVSWICFGVRLPWVHGCRYAKRILASRWPHGNPLDRGDRRYWCHAVHGVAGVGVGAPSYNAAAHQSPAYVPHDPRLELWQEGVRMATAKPPTGHGFGTEGWRSGNSPRATRARRPRSFVHAHNTVINYAIQMGQSAQLWCWRFCGCIVGIQWPQIGLRYRHACLYLWCRWWPATLSATQPTISSCASLFLLFGALAGMYMGAARELAGDI